MEVMLSLEFLGLDVNDFQFSRHAASEEVAVHNVYEWLYNIGGIPRYQTMSDTKVTDSFADPLPKDSNKDSDDIVDSSRCAAPPLIGKLSTFQEHMKYIFIYLKNPQFDKFIGPPSFVETVHWSYY